MRLVKKIILHCDDNKNPLWGLKELEICHLERGMKGIGYHYWIDYDGVNHTTRSEDIPGEHCTDHNFDSIGICLHGVDDFTLAQMITVKILVLEICKKYNLKATDIYPHSHFNKAKTCPNFLVGPIQNYAHKFLNIGDKK